MSIRITPDSQLPPSAIASDIFASPAFRAIIAREFRLEAVAMELQVAEQVMLIPAFIRKPWLGKPTLILGAGFDKTGNLPTTTTCPYPQVIAQLLHELAATTVGWLEIRTAQAIPCQPDLADKVELNVDISSAANVWDSFSTHTRKNIRRSLQRGFTARIGKEPELLDAFYRLYHHSLHAIGSLPHPRQFFTELLNQCPQHCTIFVGYMEGIPVVTAFNFVSPDELYGAWSGTHPDYKKHNVFLTMLWQLIEYCAATGRKTYNLGRSSTGSNPYQFKQKLANREHKLHYYRFKVDTATHTPSRLQTAASWLIRHSPPAVMDGLSRALLHRFY